MPFVAGFLKIVKRRPGKPDTGLPEGNGDDDVDPGYGVEEGELPEVEPPDPPPGIWPPLTPEHPWQPLPPSGGQLPVFPPGAIWPPLPPGVSGQYLALVLIGGGGKGVHYRYVVVDANAQLPTPPAGGIGGTPPNVRPPGS